MIETQFFILIITTFLVPSRQKHLSSHRDHHLGNPELYDYVQAQEVPLPGYLEEAQHLADIPDPELMQYLNPNDDDSSEPDFIEVGRFPPKKVVLPYVVQFPSGAIRERVPFNRLQRIQPLYLRRHLKNLPISQDIQRKPFFFRDSQLPGQTQAKPEQDEASEEIQMEPLILTDSQLPGQKQTKPEQDESSEEIQGLPLMLMDREFPGRTPKPKQDKTSGGIQRVPLILTGSQLPGQIHWTPEHNGDFEDTQRNKDGPSEELHKIPLIFTGSKLPRQVRSKPVQDTAPVEIKRENFVVNLPFDGVLKYLSRRFADVQPRFMFFN